MIKKIYRPSISDQDIQLALKLEDTEYSEEMKADLAKAKKKHRQGIIKKSVVLFVSGIVLLCGGIALADHWLGTFAELSAPILMVFALGFLIWGLVKSTTSASQKDPIKVMRSFINNEGDYARAFQLVAPSVSRDIPVEIFTEAWQKDYEDISNTIKSQETVTCVKCNEKINGLWSVDSYSLPDNDVRENGYFLRCESCKSVFCSNCYLKEPAEGLLQKTRYCPNCRIQLEKYLPVFLPNPDLSEGTSDDLKVSVEYEMDGKVAQLQAKTIYKTALAKITKPDGVWDSTHSDLGDRGVVEKIFYNTAVKVGEKWYLLAALPGDLVSN